MPTPVSRLSLLARGSNSALNDVSNRRNPRRGVGISDSQKAEVEEVIDQKTTGMARRSVNETTERDMSQSKVAGARRSERSTKFQASLREPTIIYDKDLYDTDSTPPSGKRKSRSVVDYDDDDHNMSHVKSPAVRHKAVRRQVKIQVPVSEDDWSEESNGDHEEAMETDDEELKIQRILAARSERRKDWNVICSKMNTSEIDSGSRWYEDADNQKGKDGDDDTFEERFLVKWDDLSYLHCSWETQKDLVEQLENAKSYLSMFFRKSRNGLLFSADERCDGDFFDPSYTQVERILEIDVSENTSQAKTFGIVMDKSDPGFDSGTGRQFLVKWGSTPYSECTYEFERDLLLNDVEYEDQVEAFYTRSKKPPRHDARAMASDGEREFRRLYMIFGDASKMKEQELNDAVSAYQKDQADIVYPNGGQLRDYQAEGVSWMIANYVNGRSCLLADEMGLGKTLQTCSFLNILANKLHRRGPFLIVAPLSTLEHWKREFNSWTNLNTIVYHGSAKNREQTREFEFAHEQDRPPRGSVAFNSSFLKNCHRHSKSKFDKLWMVQVVVTTPEMLCTDDFTELTAVEWDALVVDEAHRLKSHSSKLATNLRDSRFVFGHKLLLTGTPIQNNMTELWALLNVIDAEKFDDLNAFLEVYGNIKSKQGVDKLHDNIRPYILRRLKEDVEKSVPPKEETLIEVELTNVQKQYYRALYEKNVQFLHRNKRKALDGPSLNNLAMQLRKCCNHAFLLKGVEEEMREQEKKNGSVIAEADFLVKCSGKLVLLDKLLPRLQSNGHRVLIFSQFKIMLDIIEDYLHARSFKSERIDGSITGKKRQMAIDRFQSPGTDVKQAPFIMMLSTRAGGVGINLTAADTCIIFDSDWNPQNDLQAQARCHRIGQTKSVKIYRLLTRKTYEIQMFHLSSMKMGLDQAVLHGFENSGRDGEGAMSKDEIEKLLRHGAYDIFNEEKAGTGDAESKTFVEQDIDWILERRATTVVHENTGSTSSAVGGTFSKASFKAHTSPGASNDADERERQDVDIDDPEFWTKMVGAAKQDESSIDAGKKRKRNEANYSDALYSRDIDLAIESPASDGSESDEVPEEEFGDEMNESCNVSGKKKKRELSKWGRKNSQGWRQSDADKLVKALSAYGYDHIPWEELRLRADLTEYQCSEIQHLSWAMLLYTVLEAAQEGVIKLQKRTERALQKKKDEGEKGGFVNKESYDDSGGMLAIEHHAAGDQATDSNLEEYLLSLMQCHGLWLTPVFRDAKAYAIVNESRSEESLGDFVNSEAMNNRKAPGDNILFAQNLWPQLKNRGWKVEQVNTDNEIVVRYNYVGQTYKSTEAVMAAASTIHPELRSIAEQIRLSLDAIIAKDREECHANLSRFHPGTIDIPSLKKHIDKYAPRQLLVDRTTRRRIGLTRKLLSSCSALYNAHNIIRQAESLTTFGTVGQKIALNLLFDKRHVLPHPAWNAEHDAVLIQAIAKHGWIDYDACCRAITEDKSIEWGPPFDSAQALEAKSTEDNVPPDVITNVAQRAIQFMTSEREVLDVLKDFKEVTLVKTYNLKKIPATGDLGPVVWEVDKSSFGCDPPAVEYNSVDLPTKKDLVKRAKSILARPIVLSRRPTSALVPEQKSDHDYFVLDQTNRANVLLAEILRSLIKVSFNNSAKRRQIGRRLMNIAINEAKNRINDLELEFGNDSILLKGMSSIVEHCMFAHRYLPTLPVQAKNVLRAILGLPLVISKGLSSPFPPERASIAQGRSPHGADDNASRRQMQRSNNGRANGASGDVAIAEAMAMALQSDRGGFEGFYVKLSAPETLLLTVVCSQGLPVWTENWYDLIDSSNIIPEKQGPGFQNAISWWGMGQVFEASAKVWHHTVMKKLESRQVLFAQRFSSLPDSDASKLAERSRLDALSQDEIRRRKTLAIAGDYKSNPEKLAKKCIMLLESLRDHGGLIETIVGKNKADIVKLHQTDNGLGPFVLEWLAEEIRRWAESLSLLDDNGQPFSLTASDFIADDDSAQHDVVALMDSRCCRRVFAQVGQQSRVRELFIKHTDADFKSLLKIAVRDFAPLVEWEQAPSWWIETSEASASDFDFRVLNSLLEFGYSGIEQMLADFDEEIAHDHPGARGTDLLSRSDIQYRANQLARSLHILDRNQCALAEVQKDVTVLRDETRQCDQTANQSFFHSLHQSDSHVIDVDVPNV